MSARLLAVPEPSSMPVEEAETRIGRITSSVVSVWGDVTALYQGRAWVSLGLPSWEALCDLRLGMRPKLPVDQRREEVAELTDAGLSTRAIASVTGVSRETVRKDQRQSTDNNLPVERRNVESLDGKRRRPPTPTPEQIEERKARKRAEYEAAMHRQRNSDVQQAFGAIRSLSHPRVLEEVMQHYKPLAQEWTAADIEDLGKLLIRISKKWNVKR